MNCLSEFDHFVGLTLKGLKGKILVQDIFPYFVQCTGQKLFKNLPILPEDKQISLEIKSLNLEQNIWKNVFYPNL